MRNDERSEELSNRNLKQMEYFTFELNTKNSQKYISIKAKSNFEAHLILLKIVSKNVSRYLPYFNLYNILEKYYKINTKYSYNIIIQYDEYILADWQYVTHSIMKYEHELVRDFPKLYSSRYDSEFIKKELKVNTPSFLNKFKFDNISFMKECLKQKYFNIIHVNNTYKTEITYIAIKRILKIIKNTKYWHIRRLIIYS